MILAEHKHYNSNQTQCAGSPGLAPGGVADPGVPRHSIRVSGDILYMVTGETWPGVTGFAVASQTISVSHR